MKDSALQFGHTCHVRYSGACKKEIQRCIALHYEPQLREDVWTRVQLQYVAFLKDWRTDLGGKKNFHNGPGGTYDCIALMAYYVVCRGVTGLAEIEEMELIGARLVRTTTCANGCKCDYTVCGSRDAYCRAHPEYRDAAGYRRNR